MYRSRTFRPAAIAVSIAGLMAATALPVHAVNIPEGNAITPDSTSVITFRVVTTCDGLPMDGLDVTIPDGVRNPIPEAVPGWAVEVDVPEEATDDEAAADPGEDDADAEAEEEAEPTVVRWTGGPLEDGQLLDFAMRARFPDAEGEVLEFPVVQRCGSVEVEHAPTVNLTLRYGNAAIAEIDATVQALVADVDELRADVDQLQTQVGDVNVVNLRTRVRDTESAVEALDEAVVDLDGRVTALEEEPAPEPQE